jgi:RTX calcium-binding nonapeptide repeat (4 copies)
MAQIVGTLRNNLVGTSATNSPTGADDIFVLSGNDRINGRSGDDRLFGGPGDDQLLGSLGDDLLFGQDGDDLLFGGAGADRLRVVGEDNTLGGGSDHDLLTSAGNRNWLLAGDGKDELATTANVQAGERGDANASNDLAGRDGRDRLTAEATADIDITAFGRASTSNLLHGGSDHA